MNRSHYVSRPLDATDRAIIGALSNNSRMTVRELAAQIGLASPSVLADLARSLNGEDDAVDAERPDTDDDGEVRGDDELHGDGRVEVDLKSVDGKSTPTS